MKASNRVYQVVRGDIECERYGPDEYLNPRCIASECSVSIVPVREALLRLSERGLLTWRKNRGFSVSRVSSIEANFFYCQLKHAYLHALLRLESVNLRKSNPNFDVIGSEKYDRISIDEYLDLTSQMSNLLFTKAEQWNINLLWDRIWFIRRSYLESEQERTRLANVYLELMSKIYFGQNSETAKIAEREFDRVIDKIDYYYSTR